MFVTAWIMTMPVSALTQNQNQIILLISKKSEEIFGDHNSIAYICPKMKNKFNHEIQVLKKEYPFLLSSYQ